MTFGNGGSATDANDLALDCVQPPPGMRPISAISLAMEPANISAIGNDVGIELAPDIERMLGSVQPVLAGG